MEGSPGPEVGRIPARGTRRVAGEGDRRIPRSRLGEAVGSLRIVAGSLLVGHHTRLVGKTSLMTKTFNLWAWFKLLILARTPLFHMTGTPSPRKLKFINEE